MHNTGACKLMDRRFVPFTRCGFCQQRFCASSSAKAVMALARRRRRICGHRHRPELCAELDIRGTVATRTPNLSPARFAPNAKANAEAPDKVSPTFAYVLRGSRCRVADIKSESLPAAIRNSGRLLIDCYWMNGRLHRKLQRIPALSVGMPPATQAWRPGLPARSSLPGRRG